MRRFATRPRTWMFEFRSNGSRCSGCWRSTARTLLSYLSVLFLALTLGPPAARADFHKWVITEVFTNADGTVQFIEFFSPKKDQQFLASIETVTIETNGQIYEFGSDLPGNSEDRRMLIGTAAFAALPGAPTPDYTIPPNFFSTSGSALIEYVDGTGGAPSVIDDVSPSLPTDGILSWNRNAEAQNSPTNFASVTGSVDASGAGVAVCGDGMLEAGEDCDDGNTAGGDCCSTTCSFEPPGSSCNDDDACTTADTCSNGSCQGGSALLCDDINTCTDDSCDTANGCVFTPNTATCDDDDACTPSDTCSNGSCQGGSPFLCDAEGNLCTGEPCSEELGCTATPVYCGPADVPTASRAIRILLSLCVLGLGSIAL
ncbi:MAG: hypothetical protein AAEJ52_04865, partial [Myxococcota bacterium]